MPLLEPFSPEDLYLRSRVHGSANTFKDYIPAPGDGRELSSIVVSYPAAGKEEAAAYMERLFREINWTQLDYVMVSRRSYIRVLISDENV